MLYVKNESSKTSFSKEFGVVKVDREHSFGNLVYLQNAESSFRSFQKVKSNIIDITYSVECVLPIPLYSRISAV
jgi:hypothetical protein